MTGRFEGFIIDVATPTNALGLVNNDVYRNSVCSAVFVFDTVSIIIALINKGVRIGVFAYYWPSSFWQRDESGSKEQHL